MARKPTSNSIDQLADRYAADSIGAIDHTTNAKAMALASDGVRSALRKQLAEGYVLDRVTALTGYGSATDHVLVFEMRRMSDDKGVALDRAYLRVAVNLPARTVSSWDWIDEPTLASQQVPLALAVPSRAHDAMTPAYLLEGTHQRERDFLRGMGLVDFVTRRDGAGPISEGENTIWDSAYDTNRTEPTHYDSGVNSGYYPDVIQDTITDTYSDLDYRVDKKNDPGSSDGILAPGDRPSLIIPYPRPPRPGPGPDPGPDLRGRRGRSGGG